MRLTKPLDSILGRPTKVKVLRVLSSPGLELTGRQVAVEAKVNHAGCTRTLKQLTEIGVLEMRRKGRANLYTLRDDNILIQKALIPLFRTERVLFDETVEFLKRRVANRVVSAVLFGSYARGQANDRSDFDVLLVVEGDDGTGDLEELVLRLSTDFQRRFGLSLNPYVKSVRDFQRMVASNSPPAAQIAKEGKDLFGRPVRGILSHASQ